MKKLRIAIDIGHANGTGARGNGMEEHERCALFAELLRPMLESHGHTVKLFDYPTMSNRDDINATVAAVNRWGADLGISLHCDAADNHAASGAHVCYKSAAGLEIARPIAHHLGMLLPGRAEKVVKRDNLAMLNATRPAWVLCECGFITSPRDADTIRNHPQDIAAAIANGIRDYTAKL